MPAATPNEISSVAKRSYSPDTMPNGMPSRLMEARFGGKGRGW
jgi:hypothetical protein